MHIFTSTAFAYVWFSVKLFSILEIIKMLKLMQNYGTGSREIMTRLSLLLLSCFIHLSIKYVFRSACGVHCEGY